MDVAYEKDNVMDARRHPHLRRKRIHGVLIER